jgi:hypothetical protein
VNEYLALRKDAPRRSRSGKVYFVDHSGIPSSISGSNRREEHMAIALLNLDRFWPLPGGGWFRLLDYQVPLKATHANAGIGKVDLIGISDRGRLVIVELKIVSKGGVRGEAPPAALMEGLRYAAMVQADVDALKAEANVKFGVEISLEPPIVVLLASSAWWRHWIDLPATGAWCSPFKSLIEAVQKEIRISIEYLALDDSFLVYGTGAQPPRLESVPELHPVILDCKAKIGNALALPVSGHRSTERYVRQFLETL